MAKKKTFKKGKKKMAKKKHNKHALTRHLRLRQTIPLYRMNNFSLGTPNTVSGMTLSWTVDSLNQNDVLFVATCNSTTAAATVVFLPFGFGFCLSDAVNETSFTGLFDTYKIELIKVFFYGSSTSDTAGLGTVPGYNFTNQTKLLTCVDYNSANATTSTTSGYQFIEGYANSKFSVVDSTNPNKTIQRLKIKPRILVPAVNYSGSTDNVVNMSAPWLSTATQGVVHYGVRGIVAFELPAMATNGVLNFRLTIKPIYIINLKDIR